MANAPRETDSLVERNKCRQNFPAMHCVIKVHCRYLGSTRKRHRNLKMTGEDSWRRKVCAESRMVGGSQLCQWSLYNLCQGEEA